MTEKVKESPDFTPDEIDARRDAVVRRMLATEIEGIFATPLAIPYDDDRFRSHVYFRNAWLIRGDNSEPFSEAGDSGSLVVTEDGSAAVGLIFAGTTGGEASFIIPIDTVLARLGATLVNGHGT